MCRCVRVYVCLGGGGKGGGVSRSSRTQAWRYPAWGAPDDFLPARPRQVCVPQYDVDLREERELALARLKLLCDSRLFSVTDFRSNPLRSPPPFMQKQSSTSIPIPPAPGRSSVPGV